MHKWLPFLGECLFALAARKLRYKSVASETQVCILVAVFISILGIPGIQTR